MVVGEHCRVNLSVGALCSDSCGRCGRKFLDGQPVSARIVGVWLKGKIVPRQFVAEHTECPTVPAEEYPGSGRGALASKGTRQ